MKRSALMLAGVAALTPLVMAQAHFAAAAAEVPRTFSPPTTPMMLSRMVIRELADGKQIVVKRSFRVQFVPTIDGFVLTGTPIAVSVEVPPVLARLGELERQRSDQGPFPLTIDRAGMIHAEAGTSDDRQANQQARQAATGMIETAPLPGETKHDAIQVLGTMTAQPRSSPWPTDLFATHNGERRQHRSVALGDGLTGEVEVLLRVEKWLPCGMPARFERIITTQLAGTRKVSREVWSLEPISGT